MFYQPKDGHGLPHNPFSAIVAPRPIGWISTRAERGDNLAPYSFFNAVAYAPPQVIFAGGMKDTIRNVQQTGVFAVNLVARAQLEAMNATSAKFPHGVDEFARAGVARAECQMINCPRVAASPATLECQMTQIVPLQGADDFLVIGTVVGVHIDPACMDDQGRFSPAIFGQMARLGYQDYAEIRGGLTLRRPDDPS
ncbi:MAG: flavin reductase family protein [Cypionkella sp.]|nr:flavin reductase family protein [Cypionkella sp.]